ncbi:MAG: DUF3850 domain-containing protein [Agriterribacter sp.]
MTHKLKTWPKFFFEIMEGRKSFEVRKNDRGFKVGDFLMLEEWNPVTQKYTGFFEVKEVTFILDGGQFGIEKDYVVMSIQ